MALYSSSRFCFIVQGCLRRSKVLQGSPADAQVAKVREGPLRFAGSPGEDSSRFLNVQ